MPTQTFQFASFNDGEVVVEYDVNSANWRVSTVRCINNSDYPAHGRVLENLVIIFEDTCPAHDRREWPISGVQLSLQPDYWNEVTEQWEADGIEMGNYAFQAAWPWRT